MFEPVDLSDVIEEALIHQIGLMCENDRRMIRKRRPELYSLWAVGECEASKRLEAMAAKAGGASKA